MKRTLALLTLFAAALSARAQLLDTQEYSGIGDTGVAVHGAIYFTQTSATSGRIDLWVENLSVAQKLDSTATGFEDGIITGFGFDVGAGFTWASPYFSELDPASAISGLATGTDYISFTPENPFNIANISMDIGAETYSPNPIDKALAGGYQTVFSFYFTGASSQYFQDNFNAGYFFGPPGDNDSEDLFFRFQAVSNTPGIGNNETSDKVFIVWDDGGGGFDNPVPEPSTYGLFGAMTLLALVIARRRAR